jgi:hypothetical protein
MNLISIQQRKSKVSIEDIAPIPLPLEMSFLDRFPDTLAARDLKEIVQRIITAHQNERPIIVSFGAHVIKCGLAPILCELIRRGIITGLATNGASMIHDTELALYGHTSEEVGQGLVDGTFGVTGETIDFINNSINNLVPRGYRLGAALGMSLNAHVAPNLYSSIFGVAYRYYCPLSVHVGMGTDVLHMHPTCNGSLIGGASLDDFRRFSEDIAELANGGVLLNFGSAVILPEVILKCVAIARAKGVSFETCTMVDFDMNRQYRSVTRIVDTANLLGGRGYHITTHHELILPILGGLLIGAITNE